MHFTPRTRRIASVATASAVGLVLAACGTTAEDGGSVSLSFANTYPLTHPHNECGTQLVKEKVEASNLGMEIEIFPDSQLGADAERFTSVTTGDVDMDLQGGSALSSAFPPIGVLDMFFAFDGPDELFAWFDSDASAQLKQDFEAETSAKILGVWFFGMRDFTAGKPIRTPADLQGLRLRFPNSPAYLESANAIGASPVAVAVEEVYLALQQGIVDGQENPISFIDAQSFDEVQGFVSLTEHQTGAQLVVISGQTWEGLSPEQQQALQTAVQETRAEDRRCIEQSDEEILDTWREPGGIEVVEDVDRAAFSQLAEEYFLTHLTGPQLELYKSIGHG